MEEKFQRKCTSTFTPAYRRHMSNPEIKLDDSERQKCEVWSRVMGYHRPVSSYNIGKKQEYSERMPFKLPEDSQPTTCKEDKPQ